MKTTTNSSVHEWTHNTENSLCPNITEINVRPVVRLVVENHSSQVNDSGRFTFLFFFLDKKEPKNQDKTMLLHAIPSHPRRFIGPTRFLFSLIN
jgi:hypothetical protein